MTRTPPLPVLVAEVAAEALALAQVLGQAEAIQWSPSMTPQPREDTSERAKGVHSDPTLATVIDERRLAVRAEVEATHALLHSYAAAARAARAKLAHALARWEGA